MAEKDYACARLKLREARKRRTKQLRTSFNSSRTCLRQRRDEVSAQHVPDSRACRNGTHLGQRGDEVVSGTRLGQRRDEVVSGTHLGQRRDEVVTCMASARRSGTHLGQRRDEVVSGTHLGQRRDEVVSGTHLGQRRDEVVSGTHLGQRRDEVVTCMASARRSGTHLGQRRDEVVHVGRLRRALHRRLRHLLAVPVADVIGDRRVEQHRLLADDADRAAQAGHVQLS